MATGRKLCTAAGAPISLHGGAGLLAPGADPTSPQLRLLGDRHDKPQRGPPGREAEMAYHPSPWSPTTTAGTRTQRLGDGDLVLDNSPRPTPPVAQHRFVGDACRADLLVKGPSEQQLHTALRSALMTPKEHVCQKATP